MGTDCASLVAKLILFCYERDVMMSLPDNIQPVIIDAFNTSYFDDTLNLNHKVSQIYPSELQINKANTSDTEASCLDFHLSILMI